MRKFIDILNEASIKLGGKMVSVPMQGVKADDVPQPQIIKLRGNTSPDSMTRVDKFMKQYMAATHEHPMDRGARLYGYSSIGLRRGDLPNSVYISDIMTLEAGKGHASITLKALCKLADETGVTLELTAKAYGRKYLSTKELIDWYTRYGFSVDWEGQRDEDGHPSAGMSRKPHHAPSTEALDENEEMPSTVYHGTTQANWDCEGQGKMYFTHCRDDAENYANEAALRDDNNGVRIVVQFELADLRSLEDRGAALQPDWGWVDGEEHAEGHEPTWIESFQHVGSFCVDPFHHEYKGLGTITPYRTNEV